MNFSRSALGALAGASLMFCSSIALAHAPPTATAAPAAAQPVSAAPSAKPALPPGHPATRGNRPAGPLPRRAAPPRGRPPGAPPAGELPPPQLGMAFMDKELRVSALVPSSEFPYADDNSDGFLNTKEIAAHQAELVADIGKRFSTLNEKSEVGVTGIVRVGVPPQGPEKGFPIIRFLLSRKFSAPPKTIALNYDFFESFDGDVMGFLNLGTNRGQFKLNPSQHGFVVDIAAFQGGNTKLEMISSADDAKWWYPDSTQKKGFWFLGIGTLIAGLFLGFGARKESVPQAG